MNMYLIITEGNYGSIYDDDYTCHSYYIIIFYSPPYIFQSDLITDGQAISSGKMLCGGTYIFSIIINSHYYVLQKN